SALQNPVQGTGHTYLQRVRLIRILERSELDWMSLEGSPEKRSASSPYLYHLLTLCTKRRA
ncbi:Hypothetical predicted protein, partial [Pelobates cultripes]